jgi:hypothetical protein
VIWLEIKANGVLASRHVNKHTTMVAHSGYNVHWWFLCSFPLTKMFIGGGPAGNVTENGTFDHIFSNLAVPHDFCRAPAE